MLIMGILLEESCKGLVGSSSSTQTFRLLESKSSFLDFLRSTVTSLRLRRSSWKITNFSLTNFMFKMLTDFSRQIEKVKTKLKNRGKSLSFDEFLCSLSKFLRIEIWNFTILTSWSLPLFLKALSLSFPASGVAIGMMRFSKRVWGFWKLRIWTTLRWCWEVLFKNRWETRALFRTLQRCL